MLAKLSMPWLSTLARPGLAPIVRNHGRVYAKLQWPYLSKKFTGAEKLAFLKYHYQFLEESFPSPLIERIASQDGHTLCRMDLQETGVLSLQLRYSPFEKEGDLSITLVDCLTREHIGSITFSVTHWTPESRELLIGGIQGHRFANEKARTIEITRAMFGLRPKALLVFAIQQFAKRWKIERIRAVSNELHIYRSLRKRREIAADYDLFWSECGGHPEASGLFALPLSPQLKNIAELKPNKRTVYRKRYAMFDQLAEEISRMAVIPEQQKTTGTDTTIDHFAASNL
ncbi:MAG: hypothetical protein RLZZ399_1348 [Verrucomicrobiota bacterium]|jgi:uncharacterized protein VirK/YbjX